MKSVVAKFGGSSLANAKQFKKVKDIILSDEKRSIIVVSAPGKDHQNASKVTDLFMLLHAHITLNIPYEHLLDTIYQRYHQICADLHIKTNFDDAFLAFRQSLNPNLTLDDLASRGEYFNALIMSQYLGFEMIDAKDCIMIHYDGSIDMEQTTKALKALIKPDHQYVIPGFYAATKDKQIKTFHRGGSDLTGSILAVALNVSVYENWTDVNGLYVADPTLIKKPANIEKITYTELRELAYRGASVMQQESMIPLEKTAIAVLLKNTNNPQGKGTYIAKTIENNGSIITGISGSTDFTSLTMTKDSLVSLNQTLIDVLTIFTNYHIHVEHIPTGIDTFSIIVKTNVLKNVYFHVMNDLQHVKGITDIQSEDHLALIAIVGRNMSSIPGIAGKVFSTLGEQQTNIKVIAQASNEISIIIGVDKKDYKNAIQTLYHAFY